MLDQALAKHLLSESEAELASNKKRQRDLEALVASLRIFLNIDQSAPSFTTSEPSLSLRYGSKRHRIEVGIEQFLRDAGKPMHRMQIKDHLIELGVVGTEKDPLANVSQILSSSEKFRPHGNGLWKLVDDAVPESAPHASMTA